VLRRGAIGLACSRVGTTPGDCNRRGRTGWRLLLRPSPHQALSAQPASIALAPAATSRPPVPLESRTAKTAAVGRRRAVAPVRVRARLTGNRTRRFPGPTRPAGRDCQDVCDRCPIECWRGTMPRRISTLVRGSVGGPDAAAHSVVHHGRACPWPSTGHPRLAPARSPGRDAQAEAARPGRQLVLRRLPSGPVGRGFLQIDASWRCYDGRQTAGRPFHSQGPPPVGDGDTGRPGPVATPPAGISSHRRTNLRTAVTTATIPPAAHRPPEAS
jgi:hypothetical protein